MKRFWLVIPLIAFFLLLPLPTNSISVSAHSIHQLVNRQSGEDPQPIQALCMPGIYLESPGDCSPIGPSAYLTRLAQQGITLPLQPLVAFPVDPQLAYIPYQYAQMKSGAVPVYASLDAAASHQGAIDKIAEGNLKYLSYIDTEERDGEIYFQLRSGNWVSASEGVSQRVSLPSAFHGGLTFRQTPTTSFGWIIPLQASVPSKRTPGYNQADETGRSYEQYQVVQVYTTQKVGDQDWYQVGPDEWIEGRFVGRVIPNLKPPDGVTNGRWIEVNLYEQTVSVYENNQLVFATLVATGIENLWTRPGLFQIKKKFEATPMSGATEADMSDYYYLEDVPYTMYYDGARALHGAYWRYRLGFPQSHGCVNLAVIDAHWLFNWANEGDWVYVWDPSGETPTDPKYYPGAGAP